MSDDERATCIHCREGIHLEFAPEDMGVLAGASVWVHDRYYGFGLDPHDPFPVALPQDAGVAP